MYTSVKEIPDMGEIYRRALTSGSRTAKRDPKTALEVRGVKVTDAAPYVKAIDARLSDALPTTYPFVLTFPLLMQVLTAEDFPFKALGAVHISNEITQKRALRIGEKIDVRVRGENLREHRRGLLIDMVTEVTVDGEDVWRQVSTFLGNGAKLASDADKSVRERGQESGQALGKPELPEGIAANQELRVTFPQIKTYADASGDKNPIHVSKLGAKAFGFPAPIAHGMYTAAVLLNPLEGRVGEAFTYRIDFHKPVILPAKISVWHEESAPGEWSMQVRKTSKPETLHAVAQLKSSDAS